MLTTLSTEVMKTKRKRKKKAAVLTGGVRVVDADEWGEAGQRDGSNDEGRLCEASRGSGSQAFVARKTKMSQCHV